MTAKRKANRNRATLDRQEFYLVGSILYVIVLNKEGAGEFTFFQGFSFNALPAFAAIREICRLPAHVDEFFRSRSEAATARMHAQTGYSILLIEDEFLDQLRGHPGFVCVVSGDGTYERVSDVFKRRKDPRWLHVTTVEGDTPEPKLWDVDRESLYEWTRTVISGHMAKRKMPVPEAADFRSCEKWEPATVAIPSRGHNILTPTETVLLSLGYEFDLPDDTMNGNDDEAFANALVATANYLEETLQVLNGDLKRPPGVPNVIVTVPSVFRHFKPNKVGKETPSEVRRLMREILRQSQYIAFRATAEEMTQIASSAMARMMMDMRRQELFLYTAALTVSACSLCCPVLRLPPQLDRVRALLLGLATLSHKGNEVQRRRNQLARRIGETLRSLIPVLLLAKLDGYANQSVKLIGDVPLELLPVDGLPLSLRSSVSRLPTLPGNLMMRHSMLRTPLFLNPSDFYNVLVVRSFLPNDPIRKLLEVSIPVVLKAKAKVKVKFVDVSNEEEFIQAFNGFSGKLAIFDGHGAQSPNDPQGTLSVGSLKINPFQFYGKIKLPPIIFLSACETHSLEGFESSVASAFLFMGARSVLGTLAPIDARMSALLIARFLYRLKAFLPVLQGPMNWTEVVTGMLRMSYVTDMTFKFEQLHGLPFGTLRNVQMRANIAINSGDPSWFDQVLEEFAKSTNESADAVRERWLDTCYFSETLRYAHLGSPEHLWVFPEKRSRKRGS